MKAILAIDPGTTCGLALLVSGKILSSGTWGLKGNRYAGGGMRFVRLQNCLNAIAEAYQIEGVAFEEVRRHAGTDAAHVYGGIIATITACCEQKQIPYQGIPVGTIKKLATGRGNASKEDIVEAARKMWPGKPLEDDNEADARFIAIAAKEVFKAVVEATEVDK